VEVITTIDFLVDALHHAVLVEDTIIQTGWWFGTFFIFPYTGNNNPN
jgi:hypothetical protein